MPPGNDATQEELPGWRGQPRATPRWLIRLEIGMIAALLAGLGLVLGWGAWLNPKVDQATQLLSELEELDRAGARWAAETGAAPGTRVQFAEVQPFIQPQTRQLARRGADPLGNPWPEFAVGPNQHPRVPPQSWDELTPWLGEAFWRPFSRGE